MSVVVVMSTVTVRKLLQVLRFGWQLALRASLKAMPSLWLRVPFWLFVGGVFFVLSWFTVSPGYDAAEIPSYWRDQCCREKELRRFFVSCRTRRSPVDIEKILPRRSCGFVPTIKASSAAIQQKGAAEIWCRVGAGRDDRKA